MGWCGIHILWCAPGIGPTAVGTGEDELLPLLTVTLLLAARVRSTARTETKNQFRMIGHLPALRPCWRVDDRHAVGLQQAIESPSDAADTVFNCSRRALVSRRTPMAMSNVNGNCWIGRRGT